jgi:hypothetical protein
LLDSHFLQALDAALVDRGQEVAVYLVFDRPALERERPGLSRTHYARRCMSEAALESVIEVYRELGAYVELFEGERPFAAALASGRLQGLRRPLQIAYNERLWCQRWRMPTACRRPTPTHTGAH